MEVHDAVAQERLQGQHGFPEELRAVHQHEVGGEALQEGHRLRSINGVGLEQRNRRRNGRFDPLGKEETILQGSAPPLIGRQSPPGLQLPQKGTGIAVALKADQAALPGGGGRMLHNHPHQIENLAGPLHQPALVEAIAAENHHPSGTGFIPGRRAHRGSRI